MALKWKNFIAYDYKELLEALENAFGRLHYQYSGGRYKESITLGSKENSYMYRVTIKKDHEIQIKVLEAVADPVTKVASHIVNSRQYFGGACYLEVTPFDKESKMAAKKIFQLILKDSKKEPWDLTGHPRFKLAILLRMQIRTNWKKLLNN